MPEICRFYGIVIKLKPSRYDDGSRPDCEPENVAKRPTHRMCLRNQLVRSPSSCVRVRDRHDHQLVGLVFLCERVEIAADGAGRSEDPAAATRDRRRRLRVLLEEPQGDVDRRNRNRLTLQHQRERIT